MSQCTVVCCDASKSIIQLTLHVNLFTYGDWYCGRNESGNKHAFCQCAHPFTVENVFLFVNRMKNGSIECDQLTLIQCTHIFFFSPFERRPLMKYPNKCCCMRFVVIHIQIQLFCLNSKQKRNTIDSFCKKRPHLIQNWWTFSTFVSLNIFVISWIQMDIELWQPSFYRFAYSFQKQISAYAFKKAGR